MIVTTRARDGEAHQATGDDVNTVINDFILPIQKRRPKARNPMAAKGRLSSPKVIGSQLLNNKLIERQILIERAHYIIAVGVGIGIDSIATAKPVAARIRVSRHIQPMPRPAFTVMRRGQQTVNQLGPCIRRIVGHELLHFAYVGINPVKLMVARRMSVRRSARLEGSMPALVSRRRTN